MEKISRNPKELIKDILMIVVGNFLIALSAVYFIIPFSLLSGGVAGVAVIINGITGLSETVIIYCLEIGLFSIGAAILGWKFSLSTILSTIIYPLMISLLNLFPLTINVDPILASFYAGVLFGSGTGIVFRMGGSTGGMDIPALLITRFTKIDLAISTLIIDALTVIAGILTFGIEAALVGLISVFIASYMIGQVLVLGGEQAKLVHIISEKYEEISEAIQKELNRGITVVEATGGYSKEKKPMLFCAIQQRQYGELTRIVKRIDPLAFLIVSDAKEIVGNGFTFTSDDD